MTWIKEGNLLYEERTIESWKEQVFNKNNTYIDRWFAIKRLEKLLTKEEFEEIQVIKDDIILELNLLYEQFLAEQNK